MIRHVSNKIIINFKRRKCKNFFKSLIKGNTKYTESLNFLLIFIIPFYFEELYSDSIAEKFFMIGYSLECNIM